MRPLFIASCLLMFNQVLAGANLELVIDASKTGDEIDLTRYTLGQGGLSDKPMFDAHVEQIAQLHPQTIRVFIQEFFNLYPDHGRYHWETFDRFVENILATGAKPILSLCFKPKVLFPKIDPGIVHPNSYEEWEKLISQLVKHCNQEKKYGIEYWEISNEPDIGEDGGCPFLFQKEDYVVFYQHTAAAIQRADTKAKIGGPALAWYRSEITDSLIEHCGRTNTPLHFFSWHVYHSDPQFVRSTIREIKGKLGKYPKLKDCETIIDEWNMTLDKPNLAPEFQPAFILENTLGFYEEGLSRSAYYHIRDSFVDEPQFAKFMSPRGHKLVADWWNIAPQYCGLWDNQGRVRPAYFAFKLLSLMRGQKIVVTGRGAGVKALAAKKEGAVYVAIWNFPQQGSEAQEVTLRFPASKDGQFRQLRLNADRCLNELELLRQGAVSELEKEPIQFSLPPFGIYWITLSK